MIKKIITEISEEDFRRLDLKVSRNEKVVVSENIPGHPVVQWKMVEQPLNDILDKEIKMAIENGYESDYNDLQIPVTIAIHEPGGYYLDKFMNRFTGAQTFQIGWGIAHLYSTRDYYEAHEDYWRVSKKETKVIYRVKLSEKWLEHFELKCKTVKSEWPYNELPEGVSPDYVEGILAIGYYKSEDGSWQESYRSGEFRYDGGVKIIIPVDEEGHKVPPVWAKLDDSVN